MKEERMAILRMLESGTISADEAERLLNALQETGDKKDFSESFNNVLAKTGDVLDSLAQTIGKKAGAVAKVVSEKAEEAKPEIKKAAKVVKEKVNEAAENIREDIRKKKNSEDGIFEAEYAEKNETAKTEKDEEPAAEEAGNIQEEKAEKGTAPENGADTAQFEENRDYEAEFNKMMSETNGDIFGEVLDPINDALFEAQKEWEEQKKTDDNGDLK